MRPSRAPYDIDSLTDVALRVFADRGFDGASMDDVARAAGVTKAAIYHHVSGKDELLERGLHRALEALFSVLDEAGAREGPASGRIRHIVRRVAELAVALRPELTVLVRVRGDGKIARAALARRRTFDAAVVALVREAQDRGEIKASFDGAILVRLIFGMCNSIVEWYKPTGASSAEAVAQTVVDVVFGGIEG